MRYAVRTFVGLGLIALTATSCSYAVSELLQIGTCASGGPYVSARPCPDGVERLILVFFPAVLLMIAGAAIYNRRGTPPGSDREAQGNGFLILWVGLFLGIALGCFWGVWGPDADPGPGGELGGLIVGFLFVPMGLGGLVPLLSSLGSRGGAPATTVDPGPWTGPLKRDAATGAAPGGFGGTPARAPAAGADKVARLGELESLRRDGVVTQAEFERLKAEVLNG